MDRCKWGIVGPGNIARKFAEDFQFSNIGRLEAVASRSGLRAAEFASEYEIPRHFNNYEELFRDPGIDAVYIATPHPFHKPQAEAAIRAGKAVLCEKPLTENLENTKDLISLSESSGVYLMEGMWTWFLPAIQKAKEWFIEGRIGNITHIQASFGFPFDYNPEHRCYNPELAGGVLLDMGIYNLALSHLFVKDEPETIDVVARQAPTGVDDDVSMLIRYGGITCSLSCSFRVKMPNQAFIIGDKGIIAIPDFWRAMECFLYEGEVMADHFSEERKGFGFNFEIDAVSKDILAGKNQSDVVSHASSLRLAKAMDEVMKRF